MANEFGGYIMNFLRDKIVTRHNNGCNFECIDEAPAVAWVLFNRDYSEILLTHQFRAGSNRMFKEIPTGTVKPGETSKAAAFRELKESTGLTVTDLRDICYLGESYVNPEYSSEIISFWCARLKDSVTTKKQKICKEVQITTEWVPNKMVKDTINDMKTQLGLRMALEIDKLLVGIFGGTFSPTTNLHILTSERAVEELKLDKLIFEPVADGYAKEDIIPAIHRIKMLKASIQTNEKLICGTYETSKDGPSDTIDTLNYYQDKFGWANIFFVCGSDVLESMPTWPNTEQLLQKYSIICIQRSNANVYRDIILKNDVLLKFRHKIHIIYENVVNDVSSSVLRNLVKNNMSIRGLTPDSVIEYIKINW